MQKIWKFWFTKSGVWILKSLLYLQFLLHKKSVSREKFTKSREFTIFTFTKSGVDCTKKKNQNFEKYSNLEKMCTYADLEQI